MLEQTKQRYGLMNQNGYTLEYMCTIKLSNLWKCQLLSAFNFEPVGQHDGGARHILSEKM